MIKYIFVVILGVSLGGCAHHPADCAIGIPWSDCLAGTPGYNNGGGSDTREQALKIEMARKEGAASAVSSPSAKATTTDKLKELELIHQQGLINDSEYATKKKAILEAM
jgi:hypothetical protein